MTQTGKQLRDEGIARVLTPDDEWLERYNEILFDWFEGRPDGFRFTGEALRMAVRNRGLGEPRTHKRWGGAASRILDGWRRAGMICDTGRMVPAESPKTHGHRMPQYEKTVTRRYQYAAALSQMELLS